MNDIVIHGETIVYPFLCAIGFWIGFFLGIGIKKIAIKVSNKKKRW